MESSNPVSPAAQAVIDAPAHDEPYRFGRQPNTRAPFPFTEREFARLLIARGRLQESLSTVDQATAELP
jgi:hypothetical protein